MIAHGTFPEDCPGKRDIRLATYFDVYKNAKHDTGALLITALLEKINARIDSFISERVDYTYKF